MRYSSISQDAKKAAETGNFVLARAGEDRAYGNNHGNEHISSPMVGQVIPAKSSESGAGLAFGDQDNLQSSTNDYQRKSEELHRNVRP